MKKKLEITTHFALADEIVEVCPFGNGLINDSYLATTAGNAPDYILQRINHHIFRDVDMLQDNIDAVTTHIRKKLTERGEKDIDRKVLQFIPARDGKKYHFDGENYWRMMVHIPHSVSYETINPEYAGHTGHAFGDFQHMLSDIPVPLGETIPDFHNMEFRAAQFNEAIQADPKGRVSTVRDIIHEVECRVTEMCKAEQLHREGKLPKRVCHCDTKVNNVLFDKRNGEILCVVDLDTVMPSFIFSDVGDFMRTAANTGAEDDRDLNKVNFNMDIFKAFTKTYLESTKDFLTDIEISNVPYAAALFPYMQCVRFLTDYLNGDTYYKIQYPEHNLVRTKAQFKLLQSVEAHMKQMRDYVAGLVG
jgi:Ser/Thr protein kinase RdoA (MazF antagonist)